MVLLHMAVTTVFHSNPNKKESTTYPMNPKKEVRLCNETMCLLQSLTFFI